MSWPPRPLLPIYPMDDHKFLAFFSCLAFFFVLHNIYGSWAWSASVPIPSAPPFSPQPQNVNCLMSALICFLCLSVWLPVCVYLCVCVCFLLSLFSFSRPVQDGSIEFEEFIRALSVTSKGNLDEKLQCKFLPYLFSLSQSFSISNK